MTYGSGCGVGGVYFLLDVLLDCCVRNSFVLRGLVKWIYIIDIFLRDRIQSQRWYEDKVQCSMSYETLIFGEGNSWVSWHNNF